MNRIDRRDALRHLTIASFSVLAPGLLGACSKRPSCEDVSGLSPADVTVRRDTAAYQETALDASKKCSACAQYLPAKPDACGGCKVVKGPINPDGTCKLFAPKAPG